MRKMSVIGIAALLVLAAIAYRPMPLVRAATPIYVHPGGDDTLCNGTVNVDYSGGVAPNCAVKTIQNGVNIVSPGGTVNVVAGTYIEQINITKALTLSGAGMASTHIESPTPSSMIIYDAFGSKSPNARYFGHRATSIPVVRIAASDVTFEGFHVDLKNYIFWDVLGSYPTLLNPTYSRGVGILVDHVETVPGTPDVFTGIVIQNNKVDNLLVDDSGFAINIMGRTTATIQDNTIYCNGEQGIGVAGVDMPIKGQYYPTVTVNNNTVYGGTTGRNTPRFPAGTQFIGIGIWWAAGSVDGNTVYNYPDSSVAEVLGLSAWSSRPVSFSNNTVTNDGSGVGGWGAQLLESSNITFVNNDIENQDKAVWIAAMKNYPIPTVTLTGNTIRNSNIGVLIRSKSDAPGSPTVTMTCNTINNVVDGVVIDRQISGSVTMHYNIFTGISTGHYAVKVGGPAGTSSGTTYGNWTGPSTITVDATNNWWGATSGPFHATLNPSGTGYPVSDGVDFDPWAMVPYTISIGASPEVIPANGLSTATITATVVDMCGNPVPDGTIVSWTSTAGTIIPSSSTTNGMATTTLTSAVTPGTATVTAMTTFANYSASATGQVAFVEVQIPPLTLFNQRYLSPLASTNLSCCKNEEAYGLLRMAREKGLSANREYGEAERLMKQAEEYCRKARDFFNGGNYVASNNHALKACENFAEAIGILKRLLTS